MTPWWGPLSCPFRSCSVEWCGLYESCTHTHHFIYLEVCYLFSFLARDVVKKLTEMNISSSADFNWLAQLRYYMIEGQVQVSMVTTQLGYGYEYLGNTPRLVITPLTDRCYRCVLFLTKVAFLEIFQLYFLYIPITLL